MRAIWPWTLASLFCAGIIHVAAVFGVPYVASRDGWSRLAAMSDTNQLYMLPIAGTRCRCPSWLRTSPTLSAAST